MHALKAVIVYFHLLVLTVNWWSVPALVVFTLADWRFLCVSCPVITCLIVLATNDAVLCPLTKAENWCRRELGEPEIEVFTREYGPQIYTVGEWFTGRVREWLS